MAKRVLVGICGGSGSGKTTLARALAGWFASAVVLAEDHYYLCSDGVPDFDPARFDFDAPHAKEAALLVEHLRRLRAGEPVEAPLYDFSSHRRSGVAPVPPAAVVVVEGLHVLHDPDLRALFDHRFFVDAPEAVRFARRLQRDVRERGRTERSVADQWNGTVQPAYERWVAPQAAFADRVIDGTADTAREAERAAALVRGSLGDRAAAD